MPTIEEPSLEEKRFRLEEEEALRRHDLECRKLILEESFPKKWGAVFFGGFLTAAVAIVGFVFDRSLQHQTRQFQESQQTARQNFERQQETVRINFEREQSEITTRLKNSEIQETQRANDRESLKVYFQNIDDFNLDSNVRRAQFHFSMLYQITGNQGLADVIEAYQEQNRQPVEEFREEVAVGADLPSSVGNNEENSFYTVYIQVPSKNDMCYMLGEEVQDFLQDNSFKAPGIERVSVAPDRAQFRFYNSDQKKLYSGMAGDIGSEVGVDFESKQLTRDNLPNNIFEIWIGKNDC